MCIYDRIYNAKMVKWASKDNTAKTGICIRRTMLGKYRMLDTRHKKETIKKEQVLDLEDF